MPKLGSTQEPDKDMLIAQQAELMEKQTQMLQELQEEVDTLKAGQVQFRPMERPKRPSYGGYEPPEALMKRVMRDAIPGKPIAGSRTLMDDPTYRAKLPPQYHPAFERGEQVFLNPDATPHGHEGMTWGGIISQKGLEIGVGEILKVRITKSWEPKYQVRFPGLTRPEGDGFWESELLPVE